MHVKASAPGKAILFGEHAVVYGKPAIAMAISKRSCVEVLEGSTSNINVNIKDLGIRGCIDFNSGAIISDSPKKGILKYILESIKKVHDGSGIDINIDVNIPIGGGLGSSAAVTVATIAAVSAYNEIDLKEEEIAKYAHEVELVVQKSASPLDTTISTYGGLIYLETNAEDIVQLNIDYDIPVVIGYTDTRGDTGKLVEAVRIRRDIYPEIINPLINSIELITEEAKQAILENDKKRVGELMNINHGLLDALGVNTKELSNMVYTARNAGACGSKITGAGGGGSIIAYCPGGTGNVISAINETENALKADISKEGVKITTLH
ncbi:mevalonate kinase [Methanobacterium sp. MBAC-LM]|uniref:mevalonate kinase n=1 Tax=Methanobacterium sp. MBAC-LM TaxID=3412034 RepID=UPI003C76AA74